MKPIEAKSTIVAALLGAVVLFVFLRTKKAALLGLAVGAGVQIGVRLLGVS